MRRFFIFFGLVLILGSFLAYRFFIGSLYYAKNPSGSGRIAVTVASGDTARDVAQTLLNSGLIRSPWVFEIFLKKRGAAEKIQAGRFVFRENATLPEIVDILVSGRSEETPVTLLEGWTSRQIAAYMEKSGLGTASAFLECVRTCSFPEFIFLPKGGLEGYLFPDTYFVSSESFSPSAFVRRMISNLEGRLSESDWKHIRASQRSFSDIMIMASIVEREEADPDERPRVAGILWKRLDHGMGLGADATVLYALGRTQGGLTADDLQIDSPYNTRKYAGLPPTPISNPGLSSIRAALYPESTDFWYYLHDLKGSVHYGKTLEEHNANKKRYLGR